MGTILIVAEIQGGKIREASFELITLAASIGGDVKSLVIGSGVGELASDFASKGGGETFVADDGGLADYSVDAYNKTIRAAIEASGASLVLLSNTPQGWDVAPRLAACTPRAGARRLRSRFIPVWMRTPTWDSECPVTAAISR